MSVAAKSAEEQAAYTKSLMDAEKLAASMFDDIEQLIKPGITDKELSDAIHKLGQEKHGVRSDWHKRIVRSGPNTLAPFEANTPDRTIEADDILIVDLGPVFEQWEADFGRTYVLGNDAAKLHLRDALEPTWKRIKTAYDENPSMTGHELHSICVQEAERQGFVWGAFLGGHTLGQFPHERIPRDKVTLYITEGNHNSMQSIDKKGFSRHWILEVHLRDTANNIQGFYEQLLC